MLSINYLTRVVRYLDPSALSKWYVRSKERLILINLLLHYK
jgi:hypothetical protein